MTENKTLLQCLVEELGKRHIDSTNLPDFITDNLNPAFPIRPYQERAFRFFLNYWQESFDGKPRQNHQLLFHMATGSGKTLMMAGAMLYLYAQGYRNFLFFVNNSNIIEKTKDNFLNPSSKKYLFSNIINFNDMKIDIREVKNFQSVNLDDINIVFSTIQGLHIALNTPRENGLTYDDFEDKKVVLISDEAHHINVETKKGKNTTQYDLLETWESTVERIFHANPDNVLLEFTATIDFKDDNLGRKYFPKLIFDYPLKEFRIDGYSKEVKVLQADLNKTDRAIQAVLLSQYRRKIFEKNRLLIKPVIMFKSKTINDSQVFFNDFISCIKSLKVETLEEIKERSSRSNDSTIFKIFKYLDTNNISLENFIVELREDFSEDKLIVVNSENDSKEKQLAVNSLELNEYRAVFAVDKLNEGWDVLNLFDIVRLYDTRDSKGGKIGNTTMSEAQLIGRGARYCPFQLTQDQPLYRRKFDSDLDNEMRICEELHYHSAYNPKYIQELNTALQEIGIKPKESIERKIQLKDSFKNSELYKTGLIFLNEREKYDRSKINELDDSIINSSYTLETGYTTIDTIFETKNDTKNIKKETKSLLFKDFDVEIIRKALQRNSFYEFSNLKKYFPNLKSIAEFITSNNYLGKVKVEISGAYEKINNLSLVEKLKIVSEKLIDIANALVSENIEYKGSKNFNPKMIKSVFTDKTLNFALDTSEDKEFGKSMNNVTETNYHMDLSAKDWYTFDDCYGTSEEKLLIHYINKKYTELSKRYSDVYLIRNERHFKIYDFNTGAPFEPDFVLYLIGKERNNTMYFQVFIEPKGGHLLKIDQWKEDFLINIKNIANIEQLFSSREYIFWGLPFYNHSETIKKFDNTFEELIS